MLKRILGKKYDLLLGITSMSYGIYALKRGLKHLKLFAEVLKSQNPTAIHRQTAMQFLLPIFTILLSFKHLARTVFFSRKKSMIVPPVEPKSPVAHTQLQAEPKKTNGSSTKVPTPSTQQSYRP